MTWSQLPALPTPRRYCQAGLVTYPDGSRGILVTGGYNETSSEFLDLQTLIWQPRASLELPIELADSVPYQEAFLLVGGRSLETASDLDTVLYYDPRMDSWQTLPSRLGQERADGCSFLVPESYAQCMDS